MARLTKEQKEEKRFIKQQQKEFRAHQRKVIKKLKKAVMTKAIRLELIADLDYCNNIDLIHYLATLAKFTSDHSYIEVINKWLELETTAYNYSLIVYAPGKMQEVTEAITKHHNFLELRAKFIKPKEDD